MRLLRYQDDGAITIDKRDHLRKWLLHHDIRCTVSVIPILWWAFFLFSLFYLSITHRTRIRSEILVRRNTRVQINFYRPLFSQTLHSCSLSVCFDLNHFISVSVPRSMRYRCRNPISTYGYKDISLSIIVDKMFLYLYKSINLIAALAQF